MWQYLCMDLVELKYDFGVFCPHRFQCWLERISVHFQKFWLSAAGELMLRITYSFTLHFRHAPYYDFHPFFHLAYLRRASLCDYAISLILHVTFRIPWLHLLWNSTFSLPFLTIHCSVFWGFGNRLTARFIIAHWLIFTESLLWL